MIVKNLVETKVCGGGGMQELSNGGGGGWGAGTHVAIRHVRRTLSWSTISFFSDKLEFLYLL